MVSKVIAAEDQTAYQRWVVPEVSAGASNRLLTAQALEKLQKQAYQEAYARGYQEAFAAGKAQVQDQARRFTRLLDTLAEPMTCLDEEMERELATLAITVARHIVRREIKLDPGQVIAVIREALGCLPLNSHNVRVHLHPEDAALVHNVLAGMESDHAWKMIEDPLMSRGGCRVVTDTSHIDATVEKRLAAIAAEVLGGERGKDEPVAG